MPYTVAEQAMTSGENVAYNGYAHSFAGMGIQFLLFASIDLGRSVVVRHVSQPHFQLSIGLQPTAGGTLVTWEQAFESAEVAAALRHIVEPANEQNLSRWQAEVTAHTLGRRS